MSADLRAPGAGLDALDLERDRLICAAAARASDRADAVVAMLLRLLATLAAVLLGVWALLTYMEPCAAGQLCMAAVLTPTRLGLRQRLRELWRAARNRAEAWYLERRIAGVEFDLELLAEDQQQLPIREAYARHVLSELRVRLIELDLSELRAARSPR